MFDKVIHFFDSQNWQYSLIKDKTIAIFGISGKNGNFQCIADAIEDEFRFVFFSICGANVPEDKRVVMSELLTRLNFGNFAGNFEMNFDDGDLRYKTSIYWKNMVISEEVIKLTVLSNIQSMDTYLPAIMEVMYGNKTPLEAIALVKVIEN